MDIRVLFLWLFHVFVSVIVVFMFSGDFLAICILYIAELMVICEFYGRFRAVGLKKRLFLFTCTH